MENAAFHATPALYQDGDSIAPGNWGRLILGTGPNHPWFYREYLFERVREGEFPERPSRMACAFAFAEFDYASGWARDQQPAQYVYAVKAIGGGVRLDMSWLTVVREYRTFAGVENCARRYWRGDERDPRQIEILAPGGLQITQRLTAIPENGRTQ